MDKTAKENETASVGKGLQLTPPIANYQDNGAFNIARKGLIMDAHIKQWIKDGSKVKDLDLFVSDEEWDLCLLNRNLWNEKLSYFASRSLKQKKN